jgi:hypothetical protein
MKQQWSQWQEPRRLGNAAMVTTMLLSLCVLTYIKERYCSDPFCKCRRFSFFFSIGGVKLEGDSIRMQPRRHQSLDLVEIDDNYDSTRCKLDGPIGEEDFDTTCPTCYNTSKCSERCAAVGDIRVDGNHSLIYAISLAREWRTKQYALRHDPVAMDDVHEFTLRPFGGADNPPPLCTRNHSVSGFLFSNVLMLLFTSTHHFSGEVQFMVSDIKDWWVDKFTPFFRQLSSYDIIDVNNNWEMHCFPCIFIGSTFHTVPWASTPCAH